MIIHQTDYLDMHFDKDNSLSIQTWKKSPENATVFKNEMLLFVLKYKEVKPTKALWLHERFTLVLDDETQNWTEKNVLNPCLEAGNSKLAFVVSEDVFSHLSVINSLDDAEMPNAPKHFTTEIEALKWLKGERSNINITTEPKIHFSGLDENGNLVLKISKATDIADVLRSFNSINESGKMQLKNNTSFRLLTNREKEILVFYSKGLSTKEISSKCNVSIHTVRTHWRNIKKKLNIKTSLDALKFIRFY